MLDIQKKIDEIRTQPEHIRLRWVYGSVFVSMLFVLFIWALSIKVNFRSVPTQSSQSPVDIIGEGFGEFQGAQQESLNDVLQEEGTQ